MLSSLFSSAASVLASINIFYAGSCLAQGHIPGPPHKPTPPPMPAQTSDAWKKTSVCIQDNYSGYAINVQLVQGGKALPGVMTLQYREKNYFPILGTGQFKISLVGTKTFITRTFSIGNRYQIYYAGGKMQSAIF